MDTIVIILSTVVMISLLTYLILSYYPPIGGKPSKQQLREMSHSSRYANGKFINLIPASLDNSIQGKISILVDKIQGNPDRRPKQPLPMESINPQFIQENEQPHLIWFGHSAIYVQINGVKILLDPMLGKSPSPLPIKNKRYSEKIPIEIENLPFIDAILLSHDHYDHLDYGSIMRLKKKVKHFYVPLGVSAHLEKWGISRDRITEMDWWEEVVFEGLTLVSTPAVHYSGRNILMKDATLWCSWVIRGQQTSIFFSGDTGYGPHFKEIGQKHGPFDITLMECGQYDERWAGFHMFPEQTIQAQLDVKGKLMIPIHWGAFTLAFHDWREPIERALKAAKTNNVAISTPRIGEIFWMGSSNYPTSTWWSDLSTHDNLSGK